MKQRLKQTGKRVAAILASFATASALFACPVFADGGAYVSDSYIEIAEGETASVSVTADNAVGTYSISADGPVSAGGGGWLENESATINITGTGVGSGSVTIAFDDLATFDDEDLSGTTLTVEVVVKEPEGGYSGADKGKEDRDDVEKETEENEEQETEKETKAPKKVNKRAVTINKRQYILLNDLQGIKTPKGFVTKEKDWNGEKILVLTYGDDLVLYVLQREEDGKVAFLEYDEATKTFVAPRTILQNKVVYYVLDAKAGETMPEHLVQKELVVNDFEVKGYVSDEKALSDLVYLRVLSDGEEGIYTFDQKEGSIQRCLTLDPESEKALRDELEKAQKEVQKAKKDLELFRILLVVAGVLIVGLVIALILVLVKKKNRLRFEDLYPTDEKSDPQASAERAGTEPLKGNPETVSKDPAVSETAGVGPLNLKPLNLKPLNQEPANPAAPANPNPAAPETAVLKPANPNPAAPETAALKPANPNPAAPETAALKPAQTNPAAPETAALKPAQTNPAAPEAAAPNPPAPEKQEPEKPYKPDLNIPELKFDEEEFRNL